jgi:hypothetical protein
VRENSATHIPTRKFLGENKHEKSSWHFRGIISVSLAEEAVVDDSDDDGFGSIRGCHRVGRVIADCAVHLHVVLKRLQKGGAGRGFFRMTFCGSFCAGGNSSCPSLGGAAGHRGKW